MNSTALIVFILLFGFITWLGFIAAHWRKGDLTCCTSGDWEAAASAPSSPGS